MVANEHADRAERVRVDPAGGSPSPVATTGGPGASCVEIERRTRHHDVESGDGSPLAASDQTGPMPEDRGGRRATGPTTESGPATSSPRRLRWPRSLPTSAASLELAQLTTRDVPVIPPRVHAQIILAHETLEAVSAKTGANQLLHVPGAGRHLLPRGLPSRRPRPRRHRGALLQRPALLRIFARRADPARDRDGAALGRPRRGPRRRRLAGVERLDGGMEVTAEHLAAAPRARMSGAVPATRCWSTPAGASCGTASPSVTRRPNQASARRSGWLARASSLARRRRQLGLRRVPEPGRRPVLPRTPGAADQVGVYILENIRTDELVAAGAGAVPVHARGTAAAGRDRRGRRPACGALTGRRRRSRRRLLPRRPEPAPSRGWPATGRPTAGGSHSCSSANESASASRSSSPGRGTVRRTRGPAAGRW